jgi:hypothetical protein
MAVSRIQKSSILQGFPKSRSLLAGNAAYLPPYFESIATVTGTGSSSTVTFSSIPSTYKALQIRTNFIVSAATTVWIQFNGDAFPNTNYVRHGIVGSFSAATAYGNTGQYWMPFAGMSGGQIGTTVYPTAAIVDILDYTSTAKNKTFRAISGTEFNNTGGEVDLTSGVWLSTAAITSITIGNSSTANLSTSSTFALYGVK